MKPVRRIFAVALFAVAAFYAAHSQGSYLGRWDVILQDSSGKAYPTWLEITQPGGELKVRMVGRWGHARYLPKAAMSGAGITFTSPKDEEGGKDTDMVFEGKLSAETLAGTATGPDGAKWTWTGVRAPSLTRTATPKWGKPVQLFNGKDLSGWKLSDPAAKQVWSVESGLLRRGGRGPELISETKFDDFQLHVEFNCGKGANTGVYLRGRYEVQIEDDPNPEAPSQRTGGVYGFLDPSPAVERKPGEWQTYDITLVGRMVTVVLNGKTIIHNQEIPGVTGGALDSHEGLPGPIYLQGSEEGQVQYRNIVITPGE